MKNGFKGQASKAASLPLMALALSLAAAGPVRAQENGNPTPPPSSRPLDFRLPPADDGRTPGVQGPSDNGLPPVGPGERLGPQPTPAPTPTPPRVAPTQPATTPPANPSPTPRRETPATSRTPSDSPAAAAPTSPETPETQPQQQPGDIAGPVAAPVSVPAPAADDVPAAEAGDSDSAGTPLWAWLLAALAAVGAAFWYWRRRTAGTNVDSVDDPRPIPAAAPRAAPAPATPVAPRRTPTPTPIPPAPNRDVPAASPLVTRATGERRAQVGVRLDIRSIRFAPDHVAVGFALHLVNEGALPATGLMVRIALNQGSAMPEPVLGRFFDGAGGSVLRDDIMLASGGGEELSTEVMLPRAAVEPLMIAGKPMLVPVMAFDVTYHWDGEGEAFGQNASSFVLGREQGASGSEKLAPLALDRASYAVDRPGARATAIRRTQ